MRCSAIAGTGLLIRAGPRPTLAPRQRLILAQEPFMTITTAHITPLVALVGGILILLMPRLLNYIVAIYLILVGLMGLNSIHHFIR
jgi:hypothetical protein